ncbi:unnamed protein product [Phyllotreta striolata]|uniref:C2H2-type domain-containing protein n=1 Tax=Phyllotreta striolata TaxID=444603 RepID=A0A9N9TMR6_PHYSR|nr:unnamed protein product [Phyllotreta striolata]
MENNKGCNYICRACLSIVQINTHSFGYVEDATGNLRDMLLTCIPEMDIYISPNPIVCIKCIQELIQVYHFKSKCLNTESIIRNFAKKHNLSDENPISLNDVVEELNNLRKRASENVVKTEPAENSNPPKQTKAEASKCEVPPPLAFFDRNNGNAAISNCPRIQPIKLLAERFKSPSVENTGKLGPPPPMILMSTLLRPQNSDGPNQILLTFQPNQTPLQPVDTSMNDEINDDNNTTEESCNTSNNTAIINSDNINCHPIEKNRRLYIELTRCDDLPYNKFNNEPTSDNTNGSNSIDTEELHVFNRTDDTTENDSTKIFNCSCMYLTTSETLFTEHKSKCRHNKLHLRCPHCPHITNKSYALSKHINTMHTKAIWYHCETCSYRSTDKSSLRRHVRKNHEAHPDKERDNLYQCGICAAIIASKPNFNRHMVKHEETALSYDCEFCSYNTKDRSNFRKHVFTHSPVALQCPSCPYSNVSPYQLRTHIKKFHDGAGLEAADCRSEIPIAEIVRGFKEMLNDAGYVD